MQGSLAARVDANGLAISLMAVILILFAAAPIGYNALFFANSQLAQGTAVMCGRELSDDTKGSLGAGTSAVIEFTTASGRTVRFDGGSASRYTELGGHVSVRYDLDDPDHAMVDESFLLLRLIALPSAFAVLGIAVLSVVAWVKLRSRSA